MVVEPWYPFGGCPAIANCGARDLEPAQARQAQALRQTLERAGGAAYAFSVELFSDLVSAADLYVDAPHALNVQLQDIVALNLGATSLGVALLGAMAPIA